MAQAGDFVVNMLLATAQFDNALKASGGKIRKTADQTERQMRRVKKSGFAAAQGPTELSRGLQDLALVTSMGGGLGRGLQSTANNFGEMLTRMHPLAGLAVGVGLAFGGPLLEKLLDFNDGVSESVSQINELTTALEMLERVGKSASRQAGFLFDVADVDSSEAARRQLRGRAREQAQLRAQRGSLEERQAEIRRRFGVAGVDRFTKQVTFADFGSKAFERFEGLDEDARKNVIDSFLKIQKQLEEVASASRDAEHEALQLGSRLRELEEQEKKAAAATQAEKQQQELAAKQEKLEKQAVAAQEKELKKREEDRRRELERSARQQQRLVEQITKETRTPLEAFRARLEQIEGLAGADLLDEETARRAIVQAAERAESRLASGTGGTGGTGRTGPQFARALAFGSSEGFDAIARAIGGTKAADAAQTTAKQSQEQTALQEEMASALGRIRQLLADNDRPITVTGG